MGGFFHGWRRQAGVVMLMMALLFSFGWVRSLSTVDAVIFPMRLHTTNSLTSTTSDRFSSDKRGISWVRVHQELPKAIKVDLGSPFPAWISYSAANVTFDDSLVKWRWCGFGVLDDDGPEEGGWSTLVLIHYWFIILPLTLISLCLLLSKPHKSTQEKTGEPTAIERASIMGEFKPTVPLIYQRMERGETPKWLGLFVIFITWVILIIPVLILTFPVWGSVAAYNWFKKPAEKANQDRSSFKSHKSLN